MKRGKYECDQRRWLPGILLVVVGVLLVTTIVLIVKLCDNGSLVPQTGESLHTAPSVEKNPDSIAIPGYEVLELKANSTKQALCLPNPAQNVCYFQISLCLEDGTLLWMSELIGPGSTSKPISLIKPLDKGIYPNAILRYSCFKMDGVTPLNGAETKLTLWVK